MLVLVDQQRMAHAVTMRMANRFMTGAPFVITMKWPVFLVPLYLSSTQMMNAVEFCQSGFCMCNYTHSGQGGEIN